MRCCRSEVCEAHPKIALHRGVRILELSRVQLRDKLKCRTGGAVVRRAQRGEYYYPAYCRYFFASTAVVIKRKKTPPTPPGYFIVVLKFWSIRRAFEGNQIFPLFGCVPVGDKKYLGCAWYVCVCLVCWSQSLGVSTRFRAACYTFSGMLVTTRRFRRDHTGRGQHCFVQRTKST